jgi:hypothetical protein
MVPSLLARPCLTAISDPKWMIKGLRNRDLVSMLYSTEAEDPQERRRRSNRVTRLLRLLRAHGLLEKVPQSHRYQVSTDARTRIQALLACRNANPDQLITTQHDRKNLRGLRKL